MGFEADRVGWLLPGVADVHRFWPSDIRHGPHVRHQSRLLTGVVLAGL
jgi:hypothetical protein